jgi:hypothetical protein
MSTAGRKAAAVILAAAVSAAAGCGGGGGRLSKPAYQAKLKVEARKLGADFRGVNFQTRDLHALGFAVGKLGVEIQQVADDIDALTPPKDAVADNGKIAAALHSFADLFKQVQEAAKSGDRTKVLNLVPKIQSVANTGNAATQDLKRHGYDVGAFGG